MFNYAVAGTLRPACEATIVATRVEHVQVRLANEYVYLYWSAAVRLLVDASLIPEECHARQRSTSD